MGTSQEGEAMILLSYARRSATQPGVYWLMPDSEGAVGALHTYQEGGHCGDGIHHLYATVLGGAAPLAGVRNQCNYHAVALDHGPQRPCRCGDAGTAGGGPHRAPQAPLLVYLSSTLRRPMSALPDGTVRPVAGRASIPAQAACEAWWGVNYMLGGVSPRTGSITTSSAVSRRNVWTTSRR